VTDPLLTPEEVADYLRLTKQALADLRSSGKGPSYTHVGRLVRYRKSEVERYLEDNTVPTAG
jgi:excisionase family DNA binding protein